MFISSNTGSFSRDSFEEYKAALEACFQPENEIWCSRTEEDKYPCLSILVKGDQAVVNYFEEENGGEMLVSFGDEDAEDIVTFCGGQYEIAAWQVIPAADAMACALEFFHTQNAPDCIDWGEL